MRYALSETEWSIIQPILPVQIAQNYGVRIHLLGIIPSRGSQSQQLLQEADTTQEWDAKTIGKFLSLRGAEAAEVGAMAAPQPIVLESTDIEAPDVLAA